MRDYLAELLEDPEDTLTLPGEGTFLNSSGEEGDPERLSETRQPQTAVQYLVQALVQADQRAAPWGSGANLAAQGGELETVRADSAFSGEILAGAGREGSLTGETLSSLPATFRLGEVLALEESGGVTLTASPAPSHSQETQLRALDKLAEREARRYDGGFALY